jgi:hypothetical protein
VVRPDGTIATLAGGSDWGHTGDGGPAADARLDRPLGLGEGPDGSIYIAQSAGAIRRIDAAGTITTVASVADYIYSFTVEPGGALLVGTGERILRVRPGAPAEPVAGTGVRGWSGDGGPATAARIAAPLDLVVAPDGLYVAEERNAVVRRIAPGGRIDTVAGLPSLWGSTEAPTPALEAQIGEVRALAVLASGDVAVGTARGVYRLDYSRVPVRPLPPACGEGQGEPPEEPSASPPDEPPTSPLDEPPSSSPGGPPAGPVAPRGAPLPAVVPRRLLKAGAPRLRGRRLTLRVACAERCTARVAVRVRGRTIGSARGRIPAGSSARVAVHLRAQPLRRLRRTGGRLVLRVTASMPGRAPQRAHLALTLRG